MYCNDWLVLSDEQMSKKLQFSLLNDEQMSNWVGVKHLPDEVVEVTGSLDLPAEWECFHFFRDGNPC